MGCFLACFGSSKDRRQPRSQIKNKVLPRHQLRHEIQRPIQSTFCIEQEISAKPTNLISDTLCIEQGISAKPTNQISEAPYKLEDQLNVSTRKLEERLEDQLSASIRKLEEQLSVSTRKKVTFDTNVKAYEPVSVHGSTESLPDNNNKDVEKQEGDGSGKPSISCSQSEDDSTTSSVLSYPPNHRYQNCRESDDEVDEFECEESDLDDEEDEELEDYGDYDGDYDDEDEDSQIFVPTESLESRPEGGLSVQAFMEEEVNNKAGSNRNARDRSVYVHPVLNPVENIAQWKAVKSKGPPQPLNPPQKENLKLEQEAPCFSFSSEPILKHPSSSFKSKRKNQEIAVDASLSNWLVTAETTPTKQTRSLGTISQEQSISQGSTSPVSIEDRPILGALTVEEIKQFSASSSPRRSPSRSPDEMAIIGTVGTYWKHKEEGGNDSGSFSSYKGIPNTTSKYREDKKVNWHATPFETRLERALGRRRPAEA